MLWILLAILAHAGNGVVFIVDKGLLGTDSAAGDPKRLALYSGLLSAAAIVLAWLDFAAPTLAVVLWSFLAGVSFVIALWLFFGALSSDDASRVVPIAGSAVPFFTFVFAALFLGEVLTGRQAIAVVLLIIGGLLLSLRLSQARALAPRTVVTAILSGAAFAVYFTTVKFLYDSFPSFWSAFAYSRFAVGVVALVILGPLVWSKKDSRKASRKVTTQQRRQKKYIIGAFFGSKVLGTAMFIVQNYAINLGSVTVVNALQGTQYLFVLILAAVLSRTMPSLFQEELRRVALAQKILGILLISAGLIFLI